MKLDETNLGGTGYGVLAIANICLCLLLGFLLLGPASFGGFQPIAIASYLALFVSALTSFYLLAKRRDLDRRSCKWIALSSAGALLVAIAPLLLGITELLLS